MQVMKATITSKGQITIPHVVRRKLNLKPGDVLNFDENAGCLIAHPVFDENRMRAALGCMGGRLNIPSETWLEQTRGPVENPGD
jgi:AbrB family looped-hinge helix DNA binding protein